MSTLRHRDARVDAYIERSAGFAQPILRSLRDLVHRASPDVEETMKWSRPFFVRDGRILCNMAAFQKHCSFGIWGEGMAVVLEGAGVVVEGAMGTFGRVERREDLSDDAALLVLLREAVRRTEAKELRGRRVVKVRRPATAVPGELAEALQGMPAAATCFGVMSPSGQREYSEWVASAKRAETRERRVKQAVSWIGEGKSLNWKYQKT